MLPSIRKHILHINPGCHIFLHTYNVSTVTNPRNQEREAPLDPNEVFLFKEATRIFVENVDDFHRQQNLTKFRQYFPNRKGWVYPTSLDNMIKQWHSICQAWKIMVVHEELSRSNNTVGEFRYERVGLFRSDVLYVNDIDIMDGDATTTLFNNQPRYMSDRLFYGIRNHSKRWACGRFEHVEEYLKTKFGQVNRLHSESFLFHLLETRLFPYEFHKQGKSTMGKEKSRRRGEGQKQIIGRNGRGEEMKESGKSKTDHHGKWILPCHRMWTLRTE